MKLRHLIQNKFSIILFFAILFLTSTMTQAAEFYAIIDNLNNATNPQAQIDVGVDTFAYGGAQFFPIFFNMYGVDGAALAEFQAPTNANGFVSSAYAAPYNNLFTVSQGQPALVKVSDPSNSSLAGAVLRQTLKPSTIVFGVPKARNVDGSRLAEGRLFSVGIGDTGAGVRLLIANVSSIDVAVDVFLGTNGSGGGGKYTTPRLVNNAIWIVDIDPADANSNFVIRSTAEIIVQVAVSDAKKGISEWSVLPVY